SWFQLLLDHWLNTRQKPFGHMFLTLFVEMNEVDEKLMPSVKSRMGVHKRDIWIFLRQCFDDCGMGLIGADPRSNGGERSAIKLNHVRIARRIYSHGIIGEDQLDVIRSGD